MEVFDAIQTMLAVRAYADRPIPPDTVQRIVEAGWLTGSSMNLQPWHFVVVQERETLRKLGALARSGPYTADAALAIVVAIDKESRFGVSDASRAIQSMMLAAWAEGVGSNWVGFHGLDAVKPLLGIPDSFDVFAIIPFGYPAQPVGKGKKKRKPLAEVASRDHFGKPFTG
ncbi:MAG: nitroreductase family protein [Caldilinea sp.]|nr:nitroreductase family protein [Caldilineaceae bacterium]MCB9124696.1 nitroreductase family protein [Caldilineaceae bacterium]MCO5213909.1 nitroreductase family protein [Caldilinea sp.]MCW5844419.1 nitroreductase family protein [Caldilinea sp.]